MKSYRIVAAAVLALALSCRAQAALKDYAWKAGKKQLAKTAAKKYIPVVNVATTAYEATQFVMNGLNLINTTGNVIQGVTKNKAWAVAHTEVFGLGMETKSACSTPHAEATSSRANWLGDAASSTAWATIGGEPSIAVSGYSKGWASWIGLAGIGGRAKVEGTVLKQIMVYGMNQILDPWATPMFDENDPTELQREKDLLDPCGFDYMLRVYRPSPDPDTAGAIYYEAEVFGFLELVDEDAEEPFDAIKPAVYAVADYYDEQGASFLHQEGLDVVNLASSSFTYFEGTSEEGLPVFGYETSATDMTFNVDVPGEWLDDHDGEYMHFDFQATNGGVTGRGEVVPEPGSLAALSVAGIFVLAWARRRK